MTYNVFGGTLNLTQSINTEIGSFRGQLRQSGLSLTHIVCDRNVLQEIYFLGDK